MTKPIIYVDMDETFVNLSKEIIRQHNIDHNENYNYKQNRSYWWQDTNKPQSYFEEVLLRKGIFLNAEPMQDMIDCINKLHNEGYEIFVVTFPQFNSEWCCQEKIEYIKKHLPFIYEEERIIFTKHKHLLADSQSILIDDNPDYLIPFEMNGGYGVCIGDYGWNEGYTHNKVLSGEEVYELIHEITDKIKQSENPMLKCNLYENEEDIINNPNIDLDKYREYNDCKLHK